MRYFRNGYVVDSKENKKHRLTLKESLKRGALGIILFSGLFFNGIKWLLFPLILVELYIQYNFQVFGYSFDEELNRVDKFYIKHLRGIFLFFFLLGASLCLLLCMTPPMPFIFYLLGTWYVAEFFIFLLRELIRPDLFEKDFLSNKVTKIKKFPFQKRVSETESEEDLSND